MIAEVTAGPHSKRGVPCGNPQPDPGEKETVRMALVMTCMLVQMPGHLEYYLVYQ